MHKKFSKHLEEARRQLAQYKNHRLSEEQKEQASIELASLILKEALHIQTRKEKKHQNEIARMLQDPQGKAFTMQMTDECFRSKRTSRIANQLVYLINKLGIPKYLDWTKRLQLGFFKIFGNSLHFLLVPLATKALRKLTSQVILPGEAARLSQHMAKRRAEGVRINLNHLGEAILGEKEARQRLETYLHDLEKSDVEYISIKISTLYSQINILNWVHTLEILADRLRILYRAAQTHLFKRQNGTQVAKFVNLDMEEYKDLHITKELFKKVLDEEEFKTYSAGIVLQAYIPDSFAIQQELTEWAIARKIAGGAPIKIRIVKGANLAMEKFEASLRNFPQAPYKQKREVDANYKKMVLYGCAKQHAEAVYIGIASHNLFDIAFAFITRAENQVEKEVSFEMLEGMADHMRRVVQALAGDILLYCPIATKKEFQSAIAYLIRRLDENTGEENFLRHSFKLKPGTATWKEQSEEFIQSCRLISSIYNTPRREQDRKDPAFRKEIDTPFTLEQETDFALPQNQKWIHEVIERWKYKTFPLIPLVIEGKEVLTEEKQEGFDPSDLTTPIYEYCLAGFAEIEKALQTAKAQEAIFGQTSIEERCELLANIAFEMRKNRGDLMAVMMKDGGKSVYETDPELCEAIDFAEYYLRSMRSFSQMKDIAFSPLGTILVTPPWNFPISISSGGILSALATGNCVLFKPPPEAVLSGWVLINLFWKAGVSKEVLQFINCVDDPVGSALIKDPRVNAVILTGATSTAKLFLSMRPSLTLFAETGGKNALIISGLSDRDLAIKDLIHSAFSHSGQKCSAASLAIIEAEVYDDPLFQKHLKDAVESLTVDNCWNLSSKVIPLIRKPSKNLLRALTTLEKGEKWLVEPKQDPNCPNLFSPGVKLGVKEGSFMHTTELFGPVLGVIRAKDIEEAIRFANGTVYGLTSGIHSLDKREIHKWMKTIEAGNCYINRTTTGAIVERQPFGGYKESAFGHGSKAGGPNYLLQLLHKKQISAPEEKAPMPSAINNLTPFLEKLTLSLEELGLWFASVSSYSYYFNKYFSKDTDLSKVVGQDNILHYTPQTRMGFLIQAHDAPLDIFKVLAACLICKTPLEISFDPSSCPIQEVSALQHLCSLFTWKEERKEEFMKRVKEGHFNKVRLVSSPSPALQEAAAHSATYLNDIPSLSNGRIELTHYLREVAISKDYHRYGNLGLREKEPRAPIL